MGKKKNTLAAINNICREPSSLEDLILQVATETFFRTNPNPHICFEMKSINFIN